MLRRVGAGLVIVMVVVALSAVADYLVLARRVDRLQVSLPSSSTSGETWVIVGLDDRSKAPAQSARDVGIGRNPPTGARADVILVVHVQDGRATALSVTRDLLVTKADGSPQRLGIVWMDGPQAFVDTLCRELYIPVTHVVAVDLRAFTTTVDGLGGIDMTLAHPLADKQAGLALSAGRHHVDGRTALALVRSRQGWIKVGARWVPDPEGALGRQRRAGEVMRAVVARARTADPVTLQRVAWRALPDVSLDADTSLLEMAALRNVPAPTTLPVDQDPRTPMATRNAATQAGLVAAGFSGDCSVGR